MQRLIESHIMKPRQFTFYISEPGLCQLMFSLRLEFASPVSGYKTGTEFPVSQKLRWSSYYFFPVCLKANSKHELEGRTAGVHPLEWSKKQST